MADEYRPYWSDAWTAWHVTHHGKELSFNFGGDEEAAKHFARFMNLAAIDTQNHESLDCGCRAEWTK